MVEYMTPELWVLGSISIYAVWYPEEDVGGARWPSGRVHDSGVRGPGFDIYIRLVVPLRRT